MTQKRECQTCRYWDRLDGQNPRGECRAHPPRADNEGTHWPLTMKHDWCGEWPGIPAAMINPRLKETDR